MIVRRLIACLALLFAAPAFAATDLPTKDVAGSKDSALIKRYDGSLIVDYDYRAFNEITIPLSALERTDQRTQDNNVLFVPKQKVEFEGQITRLTYLIPEGRSPLEVVRNYQEEIARAGGEVVFTCKDEACGGDPGKGISGGGGHLSLMQHFFVERMLKQSLWSPAGCLLTNSIVDQRFFVARIPVDGKDAYVTAHSFSVPKLGSDCARFNDRTALLVHVLEPKGREQKMVKVDADAMGKALDKDGFMALYGILFDTNKAEMKPESAPVLAEIAALMKASPALAVLVVGHTDNVGAYDYNVDLSKKRAAAVVAALVKSHAVKAERLKSAGVGMAAPRAPNTSDEGKAKNRRVEIVRLN